MFFKEIQVLQAFKNFLDIFLIHSFNNLKKKTIKICKISFPKIIIIKILKLLLKVNEHKRLDKD